ncbi:hypothetical protein lerEdw1_002234 [Lerista edwardsae]|nr:hypothetical protein lerEdw1_002234 [Lerista edwardsae]
MESGCAGRQVDSLAEEKSQHIGMILKQMISKKKNRLVLQFAVLERRKQRKWEEREVQAPCLSDEENQKERTPLFD